MEDERMVQQFMSSNASSQPDFEVKLGGRSWKIHSEPFVKKSGYFRVIINNEWQESQKRVVTLTRGHHWDMIRMLQFIYCGNYYYKSGFRTDNRASLQDLMPLEDTLGKDGAKIENARDPRRTDTVMLELANYFDIPTLREFVIKPLVYRLSTKYNPVQAPSLPNYSLAQLKQDFWEVFELLQPYVDESRIIDEQETRMVDLLLKHKLSTVEPGICGQTPFGIVTDKRHEGFVGKVEQEFRLEIQVRAKENARFALKTAQRMEQCLDEASNSMSWTASAIRVCMI